MERGGAHRGQEAGNQDEAGDGVGRPIRHRPYHVQRLLPRLRGGGEVGGGGQRGSTGGARPHRTTPNCTSKSFPPTPTLFSAEAFMLLK